ncbi:class I adenylate-forming enzyme family protein [Nitrosopumilus maritimus]|uniref:AMP-dependent synthetase and ligase n=1 Tax=Nitrosopumilus maritimus (strain SCM1) TaxID=436308 RepID=A9A1S0_NITMS|nr:class I adenylate-forming enzyme family protein [Nitrosopumilus maritimus]ABX12041.1 AMP-dependent synthetase and ligase [Nitrosopumilus maritimus SCM1]
MSEENKIINSETINQIFYDIFKNNWNEYFIFDTITQKKIKYSEFYNEIQLCIDKLTKNGITEGSTICLILENSYNFVKIIFSCIFSNLTVVPIDPQKGSEEIKEIIDSVNPQTIIFDNQKNIFSKNSIEISKIVNDTQFSKPQKLEQIRNIDSDKDFLITFTSGSTGKSKGVIHSLKNLIHCSLSFNEKFHFNSKNVFLHCLPMSYMAGILNSIILPFISNSKIVIIPRFTVKTVLDFWSIPLKYSVNTFWFTPTMIGLILKFDRKNKIDLSDKNLIGCVATSSLNTSVKNDFEKKYDIELFESYGLSELLFVSTNSPNNNSFTAGQLISGTNVKFDNDEILVKVPWMFKKYFNSEKNNLENNYFSTGDLGKISKDNLLIITGRKKDLIIKGGINISPKKIEDFILNKKFLKECVILGFPDPILGEKIVCFILKNSIDTDSKKELNKKIVEHLGNDYHIDEFKELIEIPKNINGKIDKIQIRNFF